MVCCDIHEIRNKKMKMFSKEWRNARFEEIKGKYVNTGSIVDMDINDYNFLICEVFNLKEDLAKK
jgi:hypothetical protein